MHRSVLHLAIGIWREMSEKITSGGKSKASAPKKDAPAGNTPSWTIRMPVDLKAFLDAKAAEDDRSLAYLVIKILTDWAKQKGFKG